MAKRDDGGRNGAPVDESRSTTRIDDHSCNRLDDHDCDRLDELFDLLRPARRRLLLYYLQDVEGAETTLERAVRAVCSFDSVPDPPGSIPHRQAVRVSLAHDHLPRLDAAGVVEYDHRSGSVRYVGDSRLEAWLERARELELE